MMFGLGPPEGFDMSTLSQWEQKHLARGQEFMQRGSSYAMSHATVPSTSGLVLSSSPIALLAWIGEKMHRWTDTTPPLTTILDMVSLYYLTDTIPRNLYSYREIFGLGDAPQRESLPIPDGKGFGFSGFEHEIYLPPRAWAEHGIGGKEKMLTWTFHEKGGHFAALEQPEALLGDVDEFVGIVNKN